MLKSLTVFPNRSPGLTFSFQRQNVVLGLSGLDLIFFTAAHNELWF